LGTNEPPHESYAIAGGEEGKRRLNLLSEIMRPTTLWLLEEAGLRVGDRCLDAGCGGGNVVLDMAHIVGPKGRAVGVDFDPEIIDLARQDAWDSGYSTIEYHVTDVRDFGDGPFDLAHARYLLSHLSDPEKVLAHIKDLVRPGGKVAVEDTDLSGCFCYPPDGANDRFVELYTEVVRLAGGDADIGRRLPMILLAAGLGDVRWNVFQPAHVTGAHKHFLAVTMERIRRSVLRHSLATNDEIDKIVDRLHAFADDPWTLVSMPRVVQAWGTA
jgi:SAM-dependent methyltransferase